MSGRPLIASGQQSQIDVVGYFPGSPGRTRVTLLQPPFSVVDSEKWTLASVSFRGEAARISESGCAFPGAG